MQLPPLFILLFLMVIPFQANAKDPVVAGYFPFWSVYSYNFHIQDIRDERLTHIIYQYANLSEDGKMLVGDDYVDINNTYEGDGSANRDVRGSFGQLGLLKESNPDLKTIISVGGWVWSKNFSIVADNKRKRQRFAKSAADFIEKYGFDGIEVDWRFPVFGGNPESNYSSNDQENQVLLIQALRKKLDKLSLKTGKEYEIFFLSSALPHISGLPDFENINAHVDYYTLSSATINGSWSPATSHQSPLKAPASAHDQTMNLQVILPLLISHGLTPEKTILQIPSTGIGWEGVEFENRGLYQPWKSLPFGSRDDQNGTPSGIFTYKQSLELQNLPESELIWDAVGSGSYIYNHARKLMLSFESQKSIAAKLDYIQTLGFAGASLSDLAGDSIDQTSQLHSLHSYYFPWQARVMLSRDWLASNMTLVSSILSALLASLILFFIWLSWLSRQNKEKRALAHLESNKYEMIQQLALSKTIAELISVFFERYQQQINESLTLESQQKLLSFQRDHHFIYGLAHQIGNQQTVQLRARDIQLNAILLVLQTNKIDGLVENTWVHADPRALLAIWRLLLKKPEVEFLYLADELQIKVTIENSQANTERLELSQLLDLWQQTWQKTERGIVISFALVAQQDSIIELSVIEDYQVPSQRLDLLQTIQQKTILNTDIESQLTEVLAHLENDEIVREVSILNDDNNIASANSLQLNGANNEIIQLQLTRAPSQQDIEFFECINQLLQLSRSYVAQIAQQPQLLAELYDISSRLDKLNYIKAEKGYSGIYEAGKKNPRYIVMRLKAIKLYFDDQHLVQVHRSWLVNPKKVHLVLRKTKLTYVVVVGTSKSKQEEIPLGRSYLEQLKSNFPHWFDHARAQ